MKMKKNLNLGPDDFSLTIFDCLLIIKVYILIYILKNENLFTFR